MSLLCRLKKLVHKGLLKQEDLDRIVIIPKEQENKVIQMRDATPEERESINKYINNISKLTGVSFDNLEKESCEDCINREFIEIVVNYPPADICIYPEYKGKPYFSIKYRENGKEYIGFGTYKIEILSQWIKEYFISDIEPNCGVNMVEPQESEEKNG